MNIWKKIQKETPNGSRQGTINTAINKLNRSDICSPHMSRYVNIDRQQEIHLSNTENKLH